ncbi:hypothetical protein [Planktothrix sp. FACHB-1365]|uniref:hypothetical protein n=1 Tax=Planktothrix sp. FACHB-1365 TaxID=2692855 RepID=UPI0016861FBD|nr:hypothetical protein [Planktothrix sp. FACHB-1365]MBD2483345.1 hypothetical protein [Planktothrix sp. FACHB-1365]
MKTNFKLLIKLTVVFVFAFGCRLSAVDTPGKNSSETTKISNILLEGSVFSSPNSSSFIIPKPPPINSVEETAFQARGLAIREKLAAINLDEKDAWWRRIKLGDPHKYLLPIILARLSLQNEPAGNNYDLQHSWDVLLKLDQDKPDLYHFRAPLDVRIFFLFKETMPLDVKLAYRRQLESPRVLEWTEAGTENHTFMQRASGLALMNNSGFPVGDPASIATNEAWLRSELNKFLTIGQGEFHSSIYYGYSISGLLNLYDFSQDQKLRELAKGLLDWYAVNMALRLSWGTAGGAESRGFDRNTWNNGLTAVAWLWWGDQPELAQKMDDQYAWLALPASLSSYRPPEILRAIARKEIPLPFEARASHPAYYSYHQSNRLWETFYITNNYSLGTLLEPARVYQVKGTIRAQYATYKLVVRDPKGQQNAVINLGGTYHGLQATGRSPGDQLVQKRGAVIFQLILNETDLKAGVPAASHLVLPQHYGQPQRYKNWYIWKLHNIWLVARPWGDKIELKSSISEKQPNLQALAAQGNKTAWITDVAAVDDYPNFQQLKTGLDQTEIQDQDWKSQGKLSYKSLAGDRLTLTYQQNEALGNAIINGKQQVLENWPVLDSPYIQEKLYSGLLEVNVPQQPFWRLRGTLMGPTWETKK